MFLQILIKFLFKIHQLAHNKQLLDEIFCDIQNNQGQGAGYRSQSLFPGLGPGKRSWERGCYQPKPKAFIILDITKTESNNCFVIS